MSYVPWWRRLQWHRRPKPAPAPTPPPVPAPVPEPSQPPVTGTSGPSTGKTLVFSDSFTVASYMWKQCRSSAFPNMGPTNPNDHKLSYLNPVSLSYGVNGLKITATERGDGKWNTGLITTEGVTNGFELRPGDYWETRLRLPSVGGAWASVWTWGRDTANGPQAGHGEVDVMEYHTHNRLLEFTNHVNGGGHYYRGIEIQPGGWITLGISFGAGANMWYVNGNLVFADGKGVPSTWRAWPIIELALSDGTYHPKPVPGTVPTFEVAWTKVFR